MVSSPSMSSVPPVTDTAAPDANAPPSVRNVPPETAMSSAGVEPVPVKSNTPSVTARPSAAKSIASSTTNVPAPSLRKISNPDKVKVGSRNSLVLSVVVSPSLVANASVSVSAPPETVVGPYPTITVLSSEIVSSPASPSTWPDALASLLKKL